MKTRTLVQEKHIYLISAIVLVLTSIFSVGYYHVDEHYQLLEFAAFKLNLRVDTNLPWEYFDQIRPALQPAIVVGLYKIIGLFTTPNPFLTAFFLRLLSAGFSFLSMYLMYILYRDKISHPTLKKWFLILSFLLWFSIYNNVSII